MVFLINAFTFDLFTDGTRRFYKPQRGKNFELNNGVQLGDSRRFYVALRSWM